MIDLMLPTDDLFVSRADALVNAVNCKGVSGKGLALEFARRFSYNQKWYEHCCKLGTMRTAGATCWTPGPPAIVNIATKTHWQDRSTIEAVSEGVRHLVSLTRATGWRTVAVPALGCGLGGLDWEKTVLPLFDQMFTDYPRAVFLLYPPH